MGLALNRSATADGPWMREGLGAAMAWIFGALMVVTGGGGLVLLALGVTHESVLLVAAGIWLAAGTPGVIRLWRGRRSE